MKNVSDNLKACAICGKTYRPTSNRQKNCTECREAHDREANKRKCTERYRKTYEPKGYNQVGENNNAWKGGINGDYYQRKAYAYYGEKCGRCESAENLCVHHRNRDRYNNEIENLEVLCRSCHAKEHDPYENFLTP